MSDNIAQLRTEIKTWERDFKQQHGRAPSVQDIKDEPGMAEKYKLYKRLTKTATFSAPNAKSSSSDPPSTPPRSQPGSSRASVILPPKGRAVHVAPPSSTTNPFSPSKKGKQKDRSHVFVRDGERYSNPFATPTKSKVVRRAASPDPFPLIQPAQPSTPKDLHPHDPKNRAVERARKRLRGEPVSPSPVKEKRQRVGTQSVLPFGKLYQSQLPLSDEEEDSKQGSTDPSFIFDTPAKSSTNGRSFKLLFDEAPTQNESSVKPRTALSRSKTVPNNGHLFPEQRNKLKAAAAHGEDIATPVPFSQPLPGSRTHKASQSGAVQAKKPPRMKQALLNGFMPAKDDLWAAAEPSTAQLSESSASAGKSGTESPLLRGSSKRPHADAELESEQPGVGQTGTGISLIPPSPPQNPSKSYKGKPPGKGASRKKVKVVNDAEEDDDSPEEPDVRVKVSDWSWNRSKSQALHTDIEDRDLDDPVLGLASRPTRNETPVADSLIHEEAGEFEVDLPDHLRSVLSISPSKGKDRKDDAVVRELLYRERVRHYDPSKGGEIWDVGEGDDDTKASTEGEDDWEGEPIPWEAGEL